MKKILTLITLSLTLIFTSTLPILASDSNTNAMNTPSTKATSIISTKVSKVTLNTRSVTLDVGSTTTLMPTVYPDTATNKNVSWKSSNTSVATVDASGIVEAKKSGTSIITVTTEDGKKKATCKVTVPIIKVTGVTLNESTININSGYLETLTATISPTNATNKNVIWKSSNKSVATVDSSGKVVGHKAGSSVITATTLDGHKKATCNVTVNKASGTISSASVADDGTITVTLNRPELESTGRFIAEEMPVKSDFALTASGKVVKPTAFHVRAYEIVSLTVPPSNDQSVVYSVSYKGGDPVVVNKQVSNTVSNNIKIGQIFNVPLFEYGPIGPPWQGMKWNFTTDNDAINLIQTTTALPVPLVGGGVLRVWTFQATQIGSFNLQFSRETPSEQSEVLDYTINVTQP